MTEKVSCVPDPAVKRAPDLIDVVLFVIPGSAGDASDWKPDDKVNEPLRDYIRVALQIPKLFGSVLAAIFGLAVAVRIETVFARRSV